MCIPLYRSCQEEGEHTILCSSTFAFTVNPRDRKGFARGNEPKGHTSVCSPVLLARYLPVSLVSGRPPSSVEMTTLVPY